MEKTEGKKSKSVSEICVKPLVNNGAAGFEICVLSNDARLFVSFVPIDDIFVEDWQEDFFEKADEELFVKRLESITEKAAESFAEFYRD